MTSVDQLMFEVEDRTITLRVEEWITIHSALELYCGGNCLPPDPVAVGRLQTKIIRQMVADYHTDGSGA